jgi:hypothetical protein
MVTPYTGRLPRVNIGKTMHQVFDPLARNIADILLDKI